MKKIEFIILRKSIFLVIKQVTLYKFTKINTSCYKTSKTYISQKSIIINIKQVKILFF